MNQSLPSGTFVLTLARVRDADAVDRVRMQAYSGASNFRLKSASHLSVSQDPPGSQVLCAWFGDTLAATVRMAVASTLAEAEDLLGLQPPRPVALPAAVYSRGAVHPDYQGQGWMSYLLTLGLALARQQGLASALGVQAAGTSHQGAMLRAGWQVQDVGRRDYELVELPATLQFLWLEQDRFEQAVAVGLARYAALAARCDIEQLGLATVAQA